MIPSEMNTSTTSENDGGVSSELAKKLIQSYTPPDGGPTKRIPKDTAKAVSELLRILIVETRSRASVEVGYFCIDVYRNSYFSSNSDIFFCVIGAGGM